MNKKARRVAPGLEWEGWFNQKNIGSLNEFG